MSGGMTRHCGGIVGDSGPEFTKTEMPGKVAASAVCVLGVGLGSLITGCLSLYQPYTGCILPDDM